MPNLISRRHTYKAPVFAAALGLLMSFSAASQQVLNLKQSSLNFISTKNIHATEQHSFDAFSGSIDASGNLKIDVDLSSVNTIIPIRNERMRKMLFEVADYPSAIFNAKLDDKMRALAPGQRMSATLEGTLTLKDKTTQISLPLVVVGLANGSVQASTQKPIILNTEQLGVQDGIDALQQIAMLQSISKTVPVTFSVVFDKQD